VVALDVTGFAWVLNPLSVTIDPRGRFLVAGGRPQYLLFDSTGSRLPNAAGQSNSPHAWIDRVEVTSDGNLHVFDAGQHRHVSMTPGRRTVRVDSLPERVGSGIAFLSPDRMVVNMFVPTAEAARYPLHLVEGGVVRKSFGATPNAGIRVDLPATTHRHLARASDSTVWAARLNEYKIELWSIDGRLLMELNRSPSPFDTWIQDPGPSLAKPPVGGITAIHASKDGSALWVLVRLPDRAWRAAVDTVFHETPGVIARNPDRYFDTVIEVIDVRRRSVVARQRVDQFLRGFAGDRLPFSLDFSDTNKPVVRVWAARH
jgi:hypothetical protein